MRRVTFVICLLTGISISDSLFWNHQEAVNLSLANLLTFPFIQERLHSGRLQIYGMHYDFVAGRLTSWRIIQQKLSGVPSGVHN